MKTRLQRLEDYKKFLTMWFSRSPAYCEIQLDQVNKAINLINESLVIKK